ncbi:MAG: type I restriction enzyme HsdR N-terminal domain-containing protein [Desulfobacter sp.]|nr:type I restriction enzyme HsdR N-terminal domain-containing protein [Desulfobacter sp.]WDP86715.1 MAG: type I restriction enzyme HsdR N-terminal domain-containing protein [Desulfobacter sp.]
MEDTHSHHLIMGKIKDFLTGETLLDTHDERYRQTLAKHLVNVLGYDKQRVEKNRKIQIKTNGKTAHLEMDLMVFSGDRAVMMIKYAPGSLVTRRLANLALSRIIFPYQIPVVVTTNGEDAEVISGSSGKVTGQGISSIPGPEETDLYSLPGALKPIGLSLFEKASKIAYACEVDGSCMIDNDFKCSNFYCYPSQRPDQN